MRISILPSVFLLNGLSTFPVIDAFRTTTHSCRAPVPQRRRWSRVENTLIHPSSTPIFALGSSNDEDSMTSKPSSSSSSEQETQGQDNIATFSTETDTGFTKPTSDDKGNNPQTTTTRSQLQSPGPSAEDLMLAMGTNPRRIVLSLVSATGIALAGNLFGVTSRLLTAIPEDQVEATGLDTYFPRGNYKRCQSPEYTFVIPKEWVADTFVELAKAQRKVQPLDYSMQKSTGGGKMATLPDSAYGPPGRLNQNGVSQAGDTNVSVIVSSGLSGFTLRGTLGTPRDAAETLLSKSIAPEGSGRVASLLSSEQVVGQTQIYYKFEYVVDRGARGPPLQNIAVIAASPRGDKLYTLTVVAPAEKWKNPKDDERLRKIADSFHLR